MSREACVCVCVCCVSVYLVCSYYFVQMSCKRIRALCGNATWLSANFRVHRFPIRRCHIVVTHTVTRHINHIQLQYVAHHLWFLLSNKEEVACAFIHRNRLWIWSVGRCVSIYSAKLLRGVACQHATRHQKAMPWRMHACCSFRFRFQYWICLRFWHVIIMFSFYSSHFLMRSSLHHIRV